MACQPLASVRMLVVSAMLCALFGCSAWKDAVSSAPGLAIVGSAFSGQQPIYQASIEMYAMGTTGDRSAATPLLYQPVLTDRNGNFYLSGLYTCPSPSTPVYLTATGGNPGLAAGTNNTAIAEIALLGLCGNLSEATRVVINEATTVGAVWPLVHFMSSPTRFGSDTDDLPQLAAAIKIANELVDFVHGTVPDPALAVSSTAPSAKLYTLANILAACIGTAGGTAGDDSACGQLFALATTPGQAAPTDTVAAALAVARNPAQNVDALYGTLPPQNLFQPSLDTAPVDWKLTIQPSLPAPVSSLTILPSNITLRPAETITFTPSATNVYTQTIMWSLNVPVGNISANGVYTAPASISAPQTVSVIATSAIDPSRSATAMIHLKSPVSVIVTPGVSALNVHQTQQFTATVSGSSNSAVSWSLKPVIGSVSPTGLYMPPASVAPGQIVTVTATSVADPAKSATAGMTIVGSTYYMSPNGKEINNGLSPSSPWLTPNHPGLNCGDTIVAESGNYNAMTITTTPSCYRHDAVWVKCAIFDTCKINQAVYSQGGIDVQASYWAFIGWEVTASSGPYGSCFSAIPANGAASSIHDIYFMNDIANGCMAGGFVTAPTGKASVDYFAAIADIAYDAAQGSAYCYSGVSVYQPVATDTNPGTHIYASQIFAWRNLEPPTCAGTSSTDGEGIIFDTFNGLQGGLTPYAQQSAIENVITVYNGAFGVLAGGGSGNSNSPMYVRNSTAYGNFINTNQNQSMCAQMASIGWPTTNAINANRYTTFTNNLAVSQAVQLSGCGSNIPYAFYFGNIDKTDEIDGNLGYSASGQSIGYTGLTTGYIKGTNAAENPDLADPIEPPAPSCSGKASVIDCMSTVIAHFKPTEPKFASYGYQAPSLLPVYNPLFPHWLCGNPNMPLGLVTMGCLAH